MSIDWAVLANFALLWLVIVPTPGANSLMVTHVALNESPLHVAMAIAGNMIAIMLIAGAALLGWAAVLETAPWARTAVHVLGGAYLVYFGFRLLRAGHVARPATAAHTPVDAPRMTPREALTRGIVTQLSNAQAVFFVTSIYAATGVLRSSLATGLATVLVILVLNATYLGGLGWVFQRERARAAYGRARHWIETAIGALFIVFGLRLMLREMWR